MPGPSPFYGFFGPPDSPVPGRNQLLVFLVFIPDLDYFAGSAPLAGSETPPNGLLSGSGAGFVGPSWSVWSPYKWIPIRKSSLNLVFS